MGKSKYMIIEKKIWSEYFEKVNSGDKTFELRLADWECKVGDTLILKEWDPKTKNYTGRNIERKITYILKTKGAENWGMWSKDDIEKYGFQIIGLKPVKQQVKLLVFTEGTIIMHPSGKNLPREQIVEQVKNNDETIHKYINYIPIGNAVQKLTSWYTLGAEIYYLTSRKTLDEINQIQHVLIRYKFPSGMLLWRKEGEEYKDVAENLMPDILVEDDCESIGGLNEMTYTHIKDDIKQKIKLVAVREFGGIDHLADDVF